MERTFVNLKSKLPCIKSDPEFPAAAAPKVIGEVKKFEFRAEVIASENAHAGAMTRSHNGGKLWTNRGPEKSACLRFFPDI
jgi:hypothetical protein